MGMFADSESSKILPGLAAHQQEQFSSGNSNNTSSETAPSTGHNMVSIRGTVVDANKTGNQADAAAAATSLTAEDLAVMSSGSLAGILLKYLLMADHAQSTIDVLIEMDLAKESNAAIREEFSRTKGCEYIVSAMKTLGDSVDMQWKCCKLLLFLTFKHERNNIAFHHADASQVIVEAMRKFPQDRNMQSYGCGALCNLAFHNAFKVVEAGGIEVVIAAMKNYSKDPNVQVYACGCLKALASADDAFKKSIFDSGGAILLVEAQHRFRDKNDKVVHVAHEALQYMYAK